MKLFAPDYYPDFRCIADQCRHSCCIGWEIDIDEDTAAYYTSMDGSLGDKLRANICCNDDGTSSFILSEDNRCPFLKSDGLCELILELGEESLSQICSDHPRFRNYFSDRTEVGVGLCCEAAARLILTKKEPTEILCLGGDEAEEEADASEIVLLDYRDALISIAQDRSFSILERAKLIDSLDGAPVSITAPQLSAFMLGLERLDEAWTNELLLAENYPGSAIPAIFGDDNWQDAFEQLLVYLLYRHVQLEHFEKFAVTMFRLIVTILSAHYLRGDDVSMDLFTDLCRMWSSEIEYSDVNIGRICEFILN